MESDEKARIFDALATHDIVRVVMEFSGGSDEGGVDGWEYHYKHGETTAAAPAALLVDYKKIEEDMEEVMLAHFYYFNNQPSAWGTVEWDVSSRKVFLRGEEEVCSTQKIDEEL